MRILVVSGELISGDLAWRLQEEGNDIKLYVKHPLQADCQKGFVPRVRDWKKELSWVGKDGLIVFDDVGYGRVQDRLRRDGYRVFGGSEGGDRLEQDREFGMNVLKEEAGMRIEPTVNFNTAKPAIDFVRDNPAAYVVKQNNHQSALNYVGQLEDGSDTISMLRRYQDVGLKNISLQKRIEGVEVAIGRFFNGSEWVGPTSISFEHKSLFPENLGPKTGEMGTLLWYDKDEKNRFFVEVLKPMTGFLGKNGYRGYFDINSIYNSNGFYPIDVTARIGCPLIHVQDELLKTPWGEFLSAVADGRRITVSFDPGYGIVLTLALPPFPYEGIRREFLSDGLEIFFRKPMTASSRRSYHFEGVRLNHTDNDPHHIVTKSIGYALFATGSGRTVQAARQRAILSARNVIIPKIFYRTDIGNDFLQDGAEKLRKWGWL